MIGLGSNRLTVCRRGGMSVTQAGRGGMEWLAGGRIPSWASPYSAQATAALKDAFTAAQWATIRDYGVAHPALVPFINEDPMLVMSLIDGLGTRYLTPETTGPWVEDTTMYLTGAMYVETVFKWTGFVRTYASPLYGPAGRNPVDGYSRYFLLSSGRNGKSRYVYNGNQQLTNDDVTAPSVNVKHTLIDYQGKLTCDGTQLVNVGAKTFTCSRALRLFNVWGGGDIGTYMASMKVYSTQGGTLLRHYVPFVASTRQGVLDIADLEHPVFYGNSGSGSFTISETPAS